MHVAHLRIVNVRGFGEGALGVDVDLRRPDGGLQGWTVFAGPNGSGKTTVLQCIALSLLRAIPDDSVASLFGWLREGAKASHTELELLRHPEDQWVQEVTEYPPPEGFASALTIGDAWETVYDAISHGRNSSQNRAFNGPWSSSARGWFAAGYGAHRRLSGHAEEARSWMEGESRASAFVTLFREDASLLQPVRWMMDLHYRSIDAASQTSEERDRAAALLRAVLAFLNDGLLPKPLEAVGVGSRGIRVRTHGRELNLSAMGAGTRAVLALVIDLLRQLSLRDAQWVSEVSPEAPRCKASGVVLIDEPEQHLHPEWQQKLGFWFREHFPQLQFLVATHSPFICQAASPRGLLRLNAQGSGPAAQHVDEETFRRVVRGGVDDAVVTALFGLEHPHSAEAEAKRDRLAVLEAQAFDSELSPEDRRELERLRGELPSSPSATVEQVLRRLSHG